MNQTVLHAEILLRHQARERDRHVEEGRVLGALDAAASGRGRARQVIATGNVAAPSAIWVRISRFWQGWCVPGPPEARRPLCTDSPL